MPTPAEKRALVFLTAMLTLGAGVRATKARSAEPPPPSVAARADLHRQIVAVDSADSVERISGGKRRRSKRPKAIGISTTDGSDAAARPDTASRARRRKSAKLLPPEGSQPRDVGASPGGPIDLDRAQEWEILSLPKVGAGLAHRILANRDSLGPFGSLDELRRVKGVGDGVVNAITPYVTFSLSPRQSREKERDGVEPRRTDKRRKRRSPSQ
jgi:DNA uptake protein ComE-like DNA-binding protein